MITNTNSNAIDSEEFTLSKITHELRNPLTMIYSTLQLIEQSHPEVKTFKQWDNLFYDVEFMIDFLAQLSLYNHSGEMKPEPLPMGPFLKKTALSFAASVNGTGIEFTSYIEPNLPVIEGDRIQLKEVLFNLLKNAVDAIDPDHLKLVHGTINLNASVHKDQLIITIADSGCGIGPENRENIFRPFVTFKKDGTGIGLPLSQKIIQSHGGVLDFVSESGQGTTFRILLPIKQDSCQKSGNKTTQMCEDIDSSAGHTHICA